MNIGFGGETWREVIGVVSDVKQEEIGESFIGVALSTLSSSAEKRRWFIADMTFVVRTVPSRKALPSPCEAIGRTSTRIFHSIREGRESSRQ